MLTKLPINLVMQRSQPRFADSQPVAIHQQNQSAIALRISPDLPAALRGRLTSSDRRYSRARTSSFFAALLAALAKPCESTLIVAWQAKPCYIKKIAMNLAENATFSVAFGRLFLEKIATLLLQSEVNYQTVELFLLCPCLPDAFKLLSEHSTVSIRW